MNAIIIKINDEKLVKFIGFYNYRYTLHRYISTLNNIIINVYISMYKRI